MPQVDIHRSGAIALRASISSDEAAPSGASAGVAIPDDASEVVFMVGGGTSCDATVWWYNELANTWHAGTAVSLTGNQVVLGYLVGSRVDVRLTTVVGTHRIDYQIMAKEA